MRTNQISTVENETDDYEEIIRETGYRILDRGDGVVTCLYLTSEVIVLIVAYICSKFERRFYQD